MYHALYDLIYALCLNVPHECEYIKCDILIYDNIFLSILYAENLNANFKTAIFKIGTNFCLHL